MVWLGVGILLAVPIAALVFAWRLSDQVMDHVRDVEGGVSYLYGDDTPENQQSCRRVRDRRKA